MCLRGTVPSITDFVCYCCTFGIPESIARVFKGNPSLKSLFLLKSVPDSGAVSTKLLILDYLMLFFFIRDVWGKLIIAVYEAEWKTKAHLKLRNNYHQALAEGQKEVGHTEEKEEKSLLENQFPKTLDFFLARL
ncbi:hypothetical protein PHYBLDRAFT_167853 [Phycomyces blakesleeanus NRRL 1555(-)]|uniref:Uncharacterized protein n=1 Tax=Phycomyces blakesleeanus (strain ATCC 8743b / DSM 1359 / FGSC 10004 / NBRC 33097 / NRRL 1555) TaxID=763407 RepID=A0A163DZP9_PHYB8|nr:hypothetical protein PHYBLDRAFT_167853 [Phycomyces blakesleeanus NRRL 1555(-)]OAD74440.1 hypothetical protein PHYBLDRAFT_167853 [Phycomyces blakesleeanus NRRL 1555(-)]|eukprot:XP_018292480.1 hypothetical protein PHYBLDRAFT_167853 [Phycomyces blakesleeanus NRRL 1555(-)]